jgi:hypothetical protein
MAISPDPTLPSGAPLPWRSKVAPLTPDTNPMVAGRIFPDIFQEAFRRTPNHKAVGPDGVPGLIRKHIPQEFQEAINLLLQAMAIAGITPLSWLKSHTIILNNKWDPISTDKYRPITTLANALYKPWTSCIVTRATEYVINRKIVIPEQEGFRAERSCATAITHLDICIGDAHMQNKDIVLCYLYLKGAFLSTEYCQLVKVLKFLGLPEDFTRLISKLYSEASTEIVSPHGHTSPVDIRRGHPPR